MTKTSDQGQDFFFADDTGKVYRFNKASTFDGENIVSSFQTPYYSYGSPTAWKRLQSLLFEITSDNYQEIGITIYFSYDRQDVPDSSQIIKYMRKDGDVWSYGIGSTHSPYVKETNTLANPKFYPYGNGVTFSIKVDCSSKYFRPHTIHNFIAEIVQLGRQM